MTCVDKKIRVCVCRVGELPSVNTSVHQILSGHDDDGPAIYCAIEKSQSRTTESEPMKSTEEIVRPKQKQ